MNKKEEIQKRVRELDDRYGEHLDEIMDKFEVQYEKYMDATEGENYMQIILRAHLYIEFEMSELLKINLKKPTELGDKLNFNMKLRILLAMCVIPIEYKESINLLNKIRNLYAHEIDYEFDESMFERFKNSFTKEIKKTYLNKLNDDDCLFDRLRETLFALWLVLIEVRLINDEVRKELNTVFHF